MFISSDVQKSNGASGSGRGNLMARLLEKNASTSNDKKCSDEIRAIHKDGQRLDQTKNSDSSHSSLTSLSGSDKENERKGSPIVMKGSCGETVQMVTNYIRLATEPGKGIYQYWVKFEPMVDSRNTRCRLVKQLAHIVGDARSFDGIMLFLPHLLKDKVTEEKLKLHDGSDVTVSITFVKQLLMSDREAITFYNILFKRFMHILGLTLHGRNYYDSKAAKSLPEHKMEIWPGYVTAIQEFEDGVMLCCDSSFRVLSTQTVYELMEDLQYANEYNGQHGATNSWKDSLIDAVVGQKVLTRYNNKIYTVSDVDFNSTPRNTFQTSSGEITYLDYYHRQYGIEIKDPGQPLLKSEVKMKVRGKGMTEFVDLVPELSYLSGLSERQCNDHKVMKSLAQCTRISPEKRKIALDKFVTHLNTNPEIQQIFKDWGLSLAKDSLTLPGRTLEPENIIFGNGIQIQGDLSADWGRAAGSNPVLHGIPLNSWAIIAPKRSEQVVREFVNTCNQVTYKMGIQIRHPRLLFLNDHHIGSYVRELKRLNTSEMQMVVVLLPQSRNDNYSAIKKITCIENPIPSQVIISRTIQNPKNLRSVVQKIMLQINCKLGGSLWQVQTPVKNTTVLGMDTYHDPKHESKSVGALVGSMNASISSWYCRVYLQDPKRELNDGLEMAVVGCLQQYQKRNNCLPKQFIVYRDGLGDSQLEVSSKLEIPQFARACSRFSDDYKPKLLFVVVQKRIMTRLFLKTGSTLENPPPGSVMDHTITRRDLHDFFLVSQSVRQGTVTPSHYIVIHNTTSMTPDQIQRISYKMTHLYYNWCGTVRVPAPCQYAHKLAGLVGEHLHRDPDPTLLDKLFFL
ncbi:unnamed protein product [Nesidiocoris tenuis]|uniref:Piwi domain-containing protein n=1 Tax=Nesidiocoris tenuis TaxID=355587 RepID=A0A6H5H1K6_9HEMI|nr:unnamed protein product [Nesidiocoris tenuis]